MALPPNKCDAGKIHYVDVKINTIHGFSRIWCNLTVMGDLVYIDDGFINSNTDFGALTGILKSAFAGSSIEVPLRHHHEFVNPQEKGVSTLLLMPAWQPGSDAGVKLVTVSPNNSQYKLPSVQGVYIYLDSHKGGVKAVISANALTTKRTAAASALASGYLSRSDSSSLLMIGTGALSTNLIEAHAAVRPIEKVFVWGRSMNKAENICEKLSGQPYAVEAVRTIEEKIALVDIISCATLSKLPLVKGQYLRPGQHLDLVGAYKRDMREADSDTIIRSSLFVDSYQGALKEAGDLVIPLEAGLISEGDIQADLFDLCNNKKQGRVADDQITLFKSVGHALEDLVAAGYYYRKFKP